MKKVKRIIAVAILLLWLFLCGYSCYTGSRVKDIPQSLESYNSSTFYTNEGGMVAFTNGYAWYQTDTQVVLLTVEGYTDGVITMKQGEVELYFIAVDNDTLYDEQSGKFLTKGEGYG